MNELKVCPFCGGEAHVQSNRSGYYVTCLKCAVTNERLIADETTYLGYEGYDTEAEAVEAWNTRYEATCDGCVCYDNRGDYFTCESCERAYPDLYRPKEEPDAD